MSNARKALELLGPGTCEMSKAARMTIARSVAAEAIGKQPTKTHESVEALVMRLERAGQEQIPDSYSMKVVITVDLISRKLTIDVVPTTN